MLHTSRTRVEFVSPTCNSLLGMKLLALGMCWALSQLSIQEETIFNWVSLPGSAKEGNPSCTSFERKASDSKLRGR